MCNAYCISYVFGVYSFVSCMGDCMCTCICVQFLCIMWMLWGVHALVSGAVIVVYETFSVYESEWSHKHVVYVCWDGTKVFYVTRQGLQNSLCMCTRHTCMSTMKWEFAACHSKCWLAKKVASLSSGSLIMQIATISPSEVDHFKPLGQLNVWYLGEKVTDQQKVTSLQKKLFITKCKCSYNI